MDLIDLRSDTVTQPTPAMREAMARAEVGDDVYGEDPTVAELERRVAELLGKQRALFVPSGTMGNQLALLVHTRPGDEVIIGEGAHCAWYESGAGAAWSGVQFAVAGKGGLFDADEMEAARQATRLLPAPQRLVAVENTHNRAGGRVFPQERIVSDRRAGAAARARLHLDGARLWNAAVASGRAARRTRGAVRHRERVLLEGARRAGRLRAGGVRRAHRPRASLPQDARRRHAAGGHPGCRGAVRARAPSRAAGRGPPRGARPRRRSWPQRARGPRGPATRSRRTSSTSSSSARARTRVIEAAQERGVLISSIAPRALRGRHAPRRFRRAGAPRRRRAGRGHRARGGRRLEPRRPAAGALGCSRRARRRCRGRTSKPAQLPSAPTPRAATTRRPSTGARPRGSAKRPRNRDEAHVPRGASPGPRGPLPQAEAAYDRLAGAGAAQRARRARRLRPRP